MPNEIKINATDTASGSEGSDGGLAGRLSSMSPKLPWLVLAAVVAAVVILGFIFKDKIFPSAGRGAAGDSDYQAVFLSNGQVYFGKLAGSNDKYVTLKDIFYLQMQKQAGIATSSDQSLLQGQPSEVTLVKLGNELHGPTDTMKINRDHILFYEDLKGNGEIVKKIREFKSSQTAQ